MATTVFDINGNPRVVDYGPYDEDADRREAVLEDWMQRLMERLVMPWYMPALQRVEREVRCARTGWVRRGEDTGETAGSE
ncbi:MAG: hypothetical protein D6761_07830 [Candidatus Dadabacteria bacterium]|nr:MAG: hypothetical protein D6761_07830 [Candidatus Dadabacteria bacterium]